MKGNKMQHEDAQELTNQLEAKCLHSEHEDGYNTYFCDLCNKEMNIVDWLISHICLACARKNHKKVTG